MDNSTSFRTEREALKIPPPAIKPHCEHWSAEDRFFGIRIMRPRASDGSVTKSWICRYHAGGRSHREHLGRVSEVSWNDARLKALELRQRAKNRKGFGGVPTFGEAYADYKRRRQERWSEDTTLGYAKSYAFLAALGWERKKCDLITEHDASVMYAQIQLLVRRNNEALPRPKAGVTGLASAVSALRLAKIIFGDLKERGIISANPCQTLKDDGVFERADPRSRMIKAQDLPKFWSWLHTSVLPVARDYILIEFFTGFRRSIMGSLTWENLSSNAAGEYFYTLQKKARGNKAKKEIAYPLADFLVDRIIKPRQALKEEGDKWILPSPKHSGRPLRSVRGTFKALEAATEIRISDHDMRRTISTIAHNLLGDLLASRVLTHSLTAKPSIAMANTAGYVVSTHNELKQGMNQIVRYILELVEPGKKGPSHAPTTATAAAASA